jgi:hypothetical protein
MQDELHAEACTGQIGRHASILAVASLGKTETERTTRFLFRRDDLNYQQIITHGGRYNL